MNNSGNINGFNAVMLIESEFPALTYSLEADTWIKQLFKVVQSLAEYTKQQLVMGNDAEVEHCYRTAQNILLNGSNISKTAIENVFISGVSRLLEVSLSVNHQARKQFLSFFKNEYSRQINASLA